MKFILTILAALTIAATASAQKSKHLFNGHNFKNWYAYTPSEGKIKGEKLFEIRDSAIICSGKNAGYLMTKKTFKNYRLSVEFKWDERPESVSKSKRNSGVMYHVPVAQKDTLWPMGIQYQIKDGGTGDIIMLKGTTLHVNGITNQPAPNATHKRQTNEENPIGQWNTLIIEVKGDTCAQYLNGILVNEGTAASVTSGRILLQYEGSPITFKNIILAPYPRKETHPDVSTKE